MSKEYKILAPKYFNGQKVIYLRHKGNQARGIITFVETHYSSTVAENGIYAYHQYRINPEILAEKRTRGWWIGEDDIVKVIKEE